jgi:hypothetical protein
MTRNQKIRKEILLTLYAARPIGKSPNLMAKEAGKEGLDYTEREVLAECAFLRDQGLIEIQPDASGQVRYRITAKGVLDYENGTA